MTASFETLSGIQWERYWSRYLPYLLVSIAVFAVGLVFGSLATEVITASERLHLTDWLTTLLGWETGHSIPIQLYRAALLTNLKGLGILYVLGISVAGLPLVLAVLFLRGFVVGFAFAFLSQTSHHHAIGVILTTVVAQNLFMVPLYLMAGTLALWFSWNLLAFPRHGRVRPWRALAVYTGVSAVVAAGMFWATAVEVMGSPLLLHLSKVIG